MRRCALSLALVATAATVLSLCAPAGFAASRAGCALDPTWPASLLPAQADTVLALVNAHRTALGLRNLRPIPSLERAARWKAAHMAAFGYMRHDDPAPQGRSVGERFDACGYRASGWGENIAQGFPSARAVVQGWLSSPAHRANIERPGYAFTGVGVAHAADGSLYFTQDFGG